MVYQNESANKDRTAVLCSRYPLKTVRITVMPVMEMVFHRYRVQKGLLAHLYSYIALKLNTSLVIHDDDDVIV